MTPGLNGDKAIVVLDPDELDTTALRLATMWARWVLRRKLADDERELDVDAVAELVDEASRALSQHATIKGCHTVARKKIDEAGRHVDDLVGEIEGRARTAPLPRSTATDLRGGRRARVIGRTAADFECPSGGSTIRRASSAVRFGPGRGSSPFARPSYSV